MCKEKNNVCQCLFNILTSLLVGVSVAAVFYTGLVTSITTLIYITLILGILGIVVPVALTICGNKNKCECITNSNLIPSSIGAIITSLFALTITSLSTFAVTVAILIGAVAFFLTSILISIVYILLCLNCNNKCCRD